MTQREQQAAFALRAQAVELEAAGLRGLLAEVDALLAQGSVALVPAAQLLRYAVGAAESWSLAPRDWRERTAAQLGAAASGTRPLAAEEQLERAAELVAGTLADAAVEQGERLALALDREIEAHAASLLRAELGGFLRDRLSLFAERSARAACRELEGAVGVLREACLTRVAPRFGCEEYSREDGLQLLHGELGLLAGEAREIARHAVAEALPGSALVTGRAAVGSRRLKKRLAGELPARVRALSEQLGQRLAERLRARVRALAQELDRHTRAHHRMALAALTGARRLDPRRAAAIRAALAADEPPPGAVAVSQLH